MAANNKKPRLRKAPTVREIVETKTAANDQPPKKRRNFIAAPLKKIFRPFGFALRPLGKVLGWLMPRYFINAWRELRQVTWPSRGETWRLTLAVFIFAIIFGSMVAGVDKVIDIIFKKVVLK